MLERLFEPDSPHVSRAAHLRSQRPQAGTEKHRHIDHDLDLVSKICSDEDVQRSTGPSMHRCPVRTSSEARLSALS